MANGKNLGKDAMSLQIGLLIAGGPQRAAAITVWNIHYDYHRADTASWPPASRLRARFINFMTRTSSPLPTAHFHLRG